MSHDWRFPCTVEKNYDGDTVSLCIDLGFAMRHHAAVRIDGADTPELRGGTVLTKALAKHARDEVRSFCAEAGQIVFRSTVWKGKYGRPIGDLMVDGKSLAEWLIERRYAVAYDGGSRKPLQFEHQLNAIDLIEEGILEDPR